MIIAEPLSDSDVSAIARVREVWISALNADDVDGMVAPLTEDCVACPPNEVPTSGKAAQRTWHQSRVDQFRTHLEMSSQELLGGGVYAIERIGYAIHLTPRAGGPAIHTTGSCFWTWQRQGDGRWLVARAIWNSDTPLPAANAEADARAIKQVADDYTAACNAADLDGFMATCTDDIVFLPPDDNAVVGADAVAAYIKNGFFDPFQVHLSFVFDELNVAGDWAFARGPFELRLTPKPGGEPVVDRGKFIDVFQRQGDGSWRFARVIFNRNLPPA
jgi:uncharacterized protein (TIGR02246 family)